VLIAEHHPCRKASAKELISLEAKQPAGLADAWIPIAKDGLLSLEKGELWWRGGR